MAALTTIALIALGTAALGSAGHRVGSTHYNIDDLHDAHKRYMDVTKAAGYDVDIKLQLGDLRARNLITEGDYERYINIVDEVEKEMKDEGSDLWWATTHNHKVLKQATELYNVLADNYPDYRDVTKESLEEALRSSGIISADAPTPPILQVDAAPTFEEAEPMKLWTTQELADLHDLNIDADYYYDAIKQGTEANKNLAMFKADQAINAAGTNDTVDRNTYLNNIRGVKSDAIAKGATMGAQAANEILANRNAVSSAISKQNDVINNAYNSVLSSVRADADARLSATDYTNSLIKSLANDINTLYANDAIRYGQDMLSAAERYGADMDVINAQRAANANMLADYYRGQASINASNALGNDYLYMYENVLLPKNDYNPTQSALELFDYIKRNQTGYGRFATMQNEANKQ